MAWGKAGSTTLTSSGTDMSVTSMPNSKTGMALGLHSGGGSSIKLNADNGSNYASRRDVNGQGDSTNVNLSGDNAYITDTRNTPHFNITYFVNVASGEKLWINNNVYQLNAGAGNVPQREEAVGKWANTSDAISQFDYHAWNGTYSSGDNITVLGSEITPATAIVFPTNVQIGSRAEITDTRKMYDRQPIAPTTSSNYPDGNNGTNGSRIDIPTTGLTSLTDGSVAFWVYPLEAATDAADFVVLSGSDSGAASTEMIFGFIGNTSKVGIHARSGGSWLLRLNAGSLPKSQWSHVVYTNSTSSGNKVYVNGTEVTPSYTNGSASSNVFFNNITTNTFTIGANKDSGGYQWGMEGNVQQVLIYNTTLSASDVTTLYNSGNYNSSPSSTGLLRRYELESDVNDSSGNSQNGTATSISFTSLAASELTWKEIGA